MKRKELKKAIKSATPFESLYALLPEKQKREIQTVCRRIRILRKQNKRKTGRKHLVFIKKGLTFLIIYNGCASMPGARYYLYQSSKC